MINSCVFLGRLTATPELRSTQTGVSVTSFTIAVDRNFVKPGEERKADFIDCVAWKGTADFISKYFQKGSMIGVSGSMQTRTYTDKNGNKRKATELIVSEASFAGSKDSGSETSYAYTPPDEMGGNEDLPF